jgi:phosphohistidine phosphatase
MKIYLVRHGDAVPEEDAGSDRDRWLSARGRQATRGLARLLREQQIEVDAVVSSPLPRAVQTAELLAGALDFLGTIEARRYLEPAAQPGVAARDLLSRSGGVLVVGHEPAISTLAAFLLGVVAFPSFRTAQCCAIKDGKPWFNARADVMTVTALFADNG